MYSRLYLPIEEIRPGGSSANRRGSVEGDQTVGRSHAPGGVRVDQRAGRVHHQAQSQLAGQHR